MAPPRERRIRYTWRDIVIYALEGAKEDEIEYLYEEGLKVIPSYG